MLHSDNIICRCKEIYEDLRRHRFEKFDIELSNIKISKFPRLKTSKIEFLFYIKCLESKTEYIGLADRGGEIVRLLEDLLRKHISYVVDGFNLRDHFNFEYYDYKITTDIYSCKFIIENVDFTWENINNSLNEENDRSVV